VLAVIGMLLGLAIATSSSQRDDDEIEEHVDEPTTILEPDDIPTFDHQLNPIAVSPPSELDLQPMSAPRREPLVIHTEEVEPTGRDYDPTPELRRLGVWPVTTVRAPLEGIEYLRSLSSPDELLVAVRSLNGAGQVYIERHPDGRRTWVLIFHERAWVLDQSRIWTQDSKAA
jgi:hypothetical protein